jgi:hypothetical protein
MEKFIVYNNFMGLPEKVVSLDGKWWIVSRNESLAPLPESEYGDEYYRNLCSADEEITIPDLAGMMGRAMSCPERDEGIDVLESRFKDLMRLGVKVKDMPQLMDITVHIYKSQRADKRNPFIVSCYNTNDEWDDYFYIDDIQFIESALRYAVEFKNFFKNHGVKIHATLKCTDELYQELAMITFDMDYEEEFID